MVMLRRLGFLACAFLLVDGSLALANENLRSSFPGRRIGGGTRGECSARLLGYLVPSTSVFAPGPTGTVALLIGPTGNPKPLELSFAPLSSGGTGDKAKGSKRVLAASPVSVTVLSLGPIQRPTVWESGFVCDQGAASSADPLSFVETAAPPALSLLLKDATPADIPVQATIKQIKSRCGSSISRADVAKSFDLEDVIDASWPAQIPVHCL